MKSRIVTTLACLALAACADQPVLAPGDAPLAATRAAFPSVISLPTGFSPEGIAIGRGGTLFVGSIPTGAIYRADAATGTGSVLVPTQPGRQGSGIKVDQRNRLFVAGGFSGQAYVYDGDSGATLGVYQLTAPGTLVNDVVLTKDAAYFTDSFLPVLYRLPLPRNGRLPAAGSAQTIPLTGDFVTVPGQINGNGIAATPDGKTLIVVNTASGVLYRVDAATGRSARIDLGGADVVTGDGIILDGRDLYVVQGAFNRITVVRLSRDLSSGEVVRTITSGDFRFPSTIAELGGSLYAVNARFDVAPPPAPAPDVAFEVVRVSKR